MSDSLALILTVSLAVMVGDLAYRLWTESAPLLPRALVILTGICVVYWLAPGAVQTRGSIDEIAAVVVCYLSMLLGMVAQYGYAQAERGNKTFEFELMPFLMPFFASPIVFIPLLTLTSEVAVGGAFTRAKLMVYLVAFQNGFFWKNFFEERRLHVKAMARTEGVAA